MDERGGLGGGSLTLNVGKRAIASKSSWIVCCDIFNYGNRCRWPRDFMDWLVLGYPYLRWRETSDVQTIWLWWVDRWSGGRPQSPRIDWRLMAVLCCWNPAVGVWNITSYVGCRTTLCSTTRALYRVLLRQMLCSSPTDEEAVPNLYRCIASRMWGGL